MNVFRLWAVSTTALVVLGGGATAVPAWAAEGAPAATSLEEVVVTARRKEERLQSVPVAITAVSGEALRAQSIQKVEDLQRAVPGLAVSNSVRGGGSPGYAIRGQRGAITTTTLADQSVAVYFAELNLSRSVGTNQSLYDLQSVQVLKGPQGTLFGRNSTGGAILITPNKPGESFEGYVQGSVGNYGFHDFEGMVNLPVGDTFALRAAAKISRRDGYMRNVLNGQRTFDLDADSYRLSLAWRPRDGVESLLIGTYYKSGGAGASAKLTMVVPSAVGASTVAPAVVAAALQSELAATQALGRYQFRDNYPYASRDKAWSVQNNTTIELGTLGLFGDVTLKNVAGYKRVENQYTQNFVGAAISLFDYTGAGVRNESFSEELQFQGKSGPVDYVTGAYYFRETGTDRFSSNQLGYLVTPAGFAAATAAQRATILSRLPVSTRNDAGAVNKSYALFAHANVDLGGILSGLSVSGGARMTWDERAVTWRNVQQFGTAPVQYRCLPTGVVGAAPPPCSVSRHLSSSEPTYDISVNYQAGPNLLLYAVHRHGYRAGGFNIVPAIGLVSDPSYRPETVNDFEVGEKWDFRVGGMPGRLNTAVYYQKYNDVQRTSTMVTGNTLNSTIFNAAKAHISGAEIELTLQPTDRLRLTAAYALVKPAYDEWVDYYAVGGVPTPVDVSDSRFALVPEQQYSASVRYELPIPSNYGELSVLGTFAAQTSMLGVEINTAHCGPDGRYVNCLTRQARIPGYWTANLRLDWNNVGDRGFNVAAFVNNVTSEYYYTAHNNTLNALGFVSSIVGAPRMWGLEVRVPFH